MVQYKVLETNTEDDDRGTGELQLNELATEGWRLVCASSVRLRQHDDVRIYLYLSKSDEK